MNNTFIKRTLSFVISLIMIILTLNLKVSVQAKYSKNEFCSAAESLNPADYIVNIAEAQCGRNGSSL